MSVIETPQRDQSILRRSGTPSSRTGTPGARKSTSTSLSTLLEQSKRLSSLEPSNLPRLQLSLDQIENQSRKLVAKASRTNEGVDTRAHYLLAGAGIDPQETLQNLDAVNFTASFEPLQAIQDNDIEGYLKHEHEQVIISTIEEGRRETLNDFYSSVEQSMLLDWEQSRKRIFDELGQHQASGARGETPTNKSLRSSLSRGFAGFNEPDRSTAPLPMFAVAVQQSMSAGAEKPINKRLAKYADIIGRLNEYRSRNLDYAPASAFVEAVSSFSNNGANDTKSFQQLMDTWRLLALLVGENNAHHGEFQAESVKAREYVNAHMLSSIESSEASELRGKLASRARQFLEMQFEQHVEGRIASRPHEAAIGGAPSISNKVQGYLRVKYLRKEGWTLNTLEINEDGPVWATIYYLMRSGHMDQAFIYARSQEAWLNIQEKSFLAYFKAYMDSSDKRLPKTLRDRFVAEYNQRLRYSGENVDPYKMAVYKVIGRCDLSKKNVPGVTLGTEDYIWMQLMLIRESIPDEPGHERYTFLDLQDLLVKFGPAHFNPTGNKPLHYFNVLLLCGEFERAVQYLFQPNDYAIESVQFASVLTYYGLLRIPIDQSVASDFDLVTVSMQNYHEVAYVDFSRMIHQYTHLFSRTDPARSVQYMYLLTLNADLPNSVGERQVHLCHEYVRNLVLDSHEFKDLLGYLDVNGNRVPGLLEKNKVLLKIENEQEFAQRIMEQAAIRSEKEGRTDDAIQIYNLAGDYDTVVRLLIKQVGEDVDMGASVVGASSGTTATTGAMMNVGDSPVKTAQNILAYYGRDSQKLGKVSQRNRDTLRILIGMSGAFEAFQRDHLDAAMSKILSLDLLPLDETDLVNITRRAEQIRDVDEALARNIPSLMLLTMRILYKLYMQLKESPYGNEARQNQMHLYRQRARALMMYAGLVQFRMPADVYAQMTRLDVFMG